MLVIKKKQEKGFTLACLFSQLKWFILKSEVFVDHFISVLHPYRCCCLLLVPMGYQEKRREYQGYTTKKEKR